MLPKTNLKLSLAVVAIVEAMDADVVTIETHYGTYTYTVERCEVRDYQDTTTYDFTRTDENLILYTCYPFDALGFTPNRYFVYASYTSGPELDADR